MREYHTESLPSRRSQLCILAIPRQLWTQILEGLPYIDGALPRPHDYPSGPEKPRGSQGVLTRVADLDVHSNYPGADGHAHPSKNRIQDSACLGRNSPAQYQIVVMVEAETKPFTT